MNFSTKASSLFHRGIIRLVAAPVFPRNQNGKIDETSSLPRKKAAFTLVELMVAMTVLSLMILFLFSVFDQATKAWQASEKKVDAFREARAALYIMKRDLSGALIQTNLPIVSNLAGASGPIVVGAQMASTNSLFFISSQPAGSQGVTASGDLCGVGYYVAWSTNSYVIGTNTDGGVSRSYNLFRYFKDSGATYTNIANFWTGGGATNPVGALASLYPGVSSSPITGDEVLARNVVGFSVTPYYRNATNATQSLATNGAITNRLSYLEVNLTVINYDTAAKLGDAAGNGANWNELSAPQGMKNLIKKNEQDFYIRIPYRQ